MAIFFDGTGATRRTTELYNDSDRYLSGEFTTFSSAGPIAAGIWAATAGTVTTADLGFNDTDNGVGLWVLPRSSTTANILHLISGVSTVQCYLRMRPGASGGVVFQIVRAGGTTVMAESEEQALEGGTRWRHVQINVTLDDEPDPTLAAGSVLLKVDDQDSVIESGIQTSDSGTTCTRIRMTAASTAWISSVVWYPALGTLGHAVVEGFTPNEDGTYAEMTPSTGTDHFELVNDGAASLDEDDYNSTDGTTAKDTYGLTSLSVLTGELLGVSVTAHMRLEAPGTRTVRVYLETGAVEDTTAAPDDYDLTSVTTVGHTWTMETNPVTDAAWTADDMNDVTNFIGLEIDAA